MYQCKHCGKTSYADKRPLSTDMKPCTPTFQYHDWIEFNVQSSTPSRAEPPNPEQAARAEAVRERAEAERLRAEAEQRRLDMAEQRHRQARADQLRSQGRNTQAFAVEHFKVLSTVAALFLVAIAYIVMINSPSKKPSATQSKKVEDEYRELLGTNKTSGDRRDKEAVDRTSANEENKPIAQTTQEESPANRSFTVATDKAYFYTEPALSTQRKAYLIKGQSVTSNAEEEEFVYCSYTNEAGKVTAGWMLKSELE